MDSSSKWIGLAVSMFSVALLYDPWGRDFTLFKCLITTVSDDWSIASCNWPQIWLGIAVGAAIGFAIGAMLDVLLKKF